MSYLGFEDIQCPRCEHPMEAEVWSVVNVREDPELKDVLLGGELNMIECEACRNVFFQEHFLLYHEPARELMAFVYPESHELERATWEEKTRQDFQNTQNELRADNKDHLAYEPVTLFGLNALVRLVEQEDEEELQGQIVEALAPSGGFETRRASWGAARRARFPTVLPVEGNVDADARGAVLNGLKRLQTVNNNLFVYIQLQQRLLENPALPIPPFSESFSA